MEQENKIDGYEAVVVGEYMVKRVSKDGGRNPSLQYLDLLQSPSVFTIVPNSQLELSDLGLDQTTIDAIQERAKALFDENKVESAKTARSAQQLY